MILFASGKAAESLCGNLHPKWNSPIRACTLQRDHEGLHTGPLIGTWGDEQPAPGGFEEALREAESVAGGLGAYDDYYHGGAAIQRAAEKEFAEAIAKVRAAHQQSVEDARREGFSAGRRLT